jgi:GntR family transcriptional regulator
MIIDIDPSSAVPIYAQIAEQVKHAIAAGVLRPGDLLPSRRDLAVRLRINPLTVTKAYQELEAEGIVVTEHGRGTFIALKTIDLGEDYRREALTQAVDHMLVVAHQLGSTSDEILERVNDRLRALQVDAPQTPDMEISHRGEAEEDTITNE